MKTLQVLILFLFPTILWAQTAAEYKKNIYPAPIDERDLKKAVGASNSTTDVMRILSEMRGEIKKAAKAFGVDPIHVASAIAGEHAINVQSLDTIQDYAIEMNTYLPKWVQRTLNMEEDLGAMLQSPDFAKCLAKQSDYDQWYCVVSTWYKTPGYKGKKVAFGSKDFYKQFTNHFFNPNGIGSTFGVGQMSPLRALMVDDLVSRVKPAYAIRFVQEGNIEKAYQSVMDPQRAVYFIAATIKLGINTYKNTARFDISMNPGLTATLYNIGHEKIKAQQKFEENVRLLRSGQPLSPPRPNDLGRWVLQNQEMINQSIQ
jgi:hypothetical protein